MMDWTVAGKRFRIAGWRKHRWVERTGWMVVVGGLTGAAMIAHAQGTHTVMQVPAPQSVKPKSSETPSNVAERRVTLVVQDNTIRWAITAAAKQASVRTTFYGGEQALDRRISMSLKNVPLLDAMRRILEGTGLQVALASDGETVVIRTTETNTPGSTRVESQATGTIMGQVIDSATGKGISGVVVAVQGTKLSVISNDRGEFEVSPVPTGEQIVTFKLLGYTSVTRTAKVEDKKRTMLRVTFRQTVNMLSGVVTTATGEQRRMEVGHSIVSINVDSLMAVAPVQSLTDVLEGRVPGMTIQRTSGTPGDPSRIRLRGTGSVYQNNDPIIVVDGVRVYSQQSDERNISSSGVGNDSRYYATPSPLDQIDPSMIEKVEVLKGPSASAMYGSDAANGVIIVTTKRGRAGPPRATVNASVGTSYSPGSWPTVAYQWITPLYGGAPIICLGFCGDANIDSVIPFQALNHPRLTALGRGSTFESSAGVSGGNSTIMYAFTASMGREDGLLKLPRIEEERYFKFQNKLAPGWMRRPDGLEQQGITGNVTVEFTPRTRLDFITTINQQTQRRTSMSASNNTAIQKLQRMWIDLSQLNEQPILGNPYERVTVNQLNFVTGVTLSVRPVEWLPITNSLGTNIQTSNTEMHLPEGLVTGAESGGVWRGSTHASTVFSGSVYTRIPMRDRLNVTAGVNFNRQRTNDIDGALFGTPFGVEDPSVGTDTARNQFRRASSDRGQFGWYVEPRLTLSERFFLTPGFRLDNNGLAGKNAKLMGLPKMNFSWIVSDEQFFPWKSVVQSLQLRTAFGVSGVQPQPDELNRLYRLRTINPFGGTEPLYGDLLDLSTLGNTRLRPERSVELEGGFVAELWNNRLGVDFSYWKKHRRDAIVQNNYAGSVDGGGIQKMNVGDVENAGMDVTLNTQLLERRNIGFHVGMRFSYQRSKVLRLSADGSALDLNCGVGGNCMIRWAVGYPVEGRWERPIMGYDDLDGNGWLSASEVSIGSDQVYVGSTEPKYTAGIDPQLMLFGGRIGVSASLSYVSGQLQTVDGMEELVGHGDANGIPIVLGGLVNGPDGYDRQVALIALSAMNGYNSFSQIGSMQTLDVLRLQSMSLNFNLGPNIARVLKGRNARVSIQGSNLGLWTNYVGVDPNVNAFPGGRGLGDSGQQPQPRRWILRCSLEY